MFSIFPGERTPLSQNLALLAGAVHLQAMLCSRTYLYRREVVRNVMRAITILFLDGACLGFKM